MLESSKVFTLSAPASYLVVPMGAGPVVHAQSDHVADDFPVDSPRYRTDVFSNASGQYIIDHDDGAFRMPSTGNESSPGNLNFLHNGRTDLFQADITLSSERSLPAQEKYSGATEFVEGFVYTPHPNHDYPVKFVHPTSGEGIQADIELVSIDKPWPSPINRRTT